MNVFFLYKTFYILKHKIACYLSVLISYSFYTLIVIYHSNNKRKIKKRREKIWLILGKDNKVEIKDYFKSIAEASELGKEQKKILMIRWIKFNF